MKGTGDAHEMQTLLKSSKSSKDVSSSDRGKFSLQQTANSTKKKRNTKVSNIICKRCFEWRRTTRHCLWHQWWQGRK